jgi:multiple sugar transport system substrate-binding protein
MSKRGFQSTFDQSYSRRKLLGNAAKVGAGLSALSLAGPGMAERAFAQQTDITMMGWGSPLEEENVNKGIELFESQNPDINVTFNHIPNADYQTKIDTAMAGGNAPDVFWGSNMADYVSRGVTMDVTSNIQNDPVLGKPDYFIEPAEMGRATIAGKWWGIGSCWVLHHLYYNKKLFDAAGIEPPSYDASKAWTWDQYLDIARKLTFDSAGKHPDEDGFNADDIKQYGVYWENWSLPRDVLVFSNGGEAYTDDYTCHLNAPEAVEAYQALADLTIKHHVAPQAATFQQLGMANAWAALAAGTVAILTDGSWALQDISKMEFEFGCGVLPMMKTAVTEAQAHVHMVYKDTPKADASWKFLAFLASDDYQRGLVQAGLWLPSHTSLLTPEGLATWVTPGVHPEGYEQIATDYLAKYAKNYFYPAGFSDADALILAALDPVWTGDQTAEDAIANSGVIDQVNELLKEKKAKLDEKVA